MRTPVLLALGTVPVLIAMCLGCSSPDDIGDGWTAHVWSSQTEEARSAPEHDPGAPMVYCSPGHHGLKVVPIQWIDHDSGGAYQFDALRADGGRLVCVYEVNRYADCCSLAVLYDAESGECWRCDAANWRTDPAVAAKWRERFARGPRAPALSGADRFVARRPREVERKRISPQRKGKRGILLRALSCPLR